MLVARDELNGDLVTQRQITSVHHIEVEGDGLLAIETAQVPLVGATDANSSVTYELVLLIRASDLANCTANLDLLRAEHLEMRQEAHLELTSVVYLEELFEALLEHRVAKRVRHDVEAASLLEAWLQLKHADLIDRRDKSVDDDAALLGTVSQALEELDGRLQVLRVLV